MKGTTLLVIFVVIIIAIGTGIFMTAEKPPVPPVTSPQTPTPVTPRVTATQVAPAGGHSWISAYTGPETCLECHRDAAVSMFGSAHYQWTGPTPNVPNIAGTAGKAEGGFNTYCGCIFSSRRFACWSCHAGAGLTPNQTVSDAQLANIDCMTCHQEVYVRKPAPPFENITSTDYAGITRTWLLPIEDGLGNFRYIPDESRMPVSVVAAAQGVHLPTRTTCLSCHAYAAGSDCGKRGELSTAMRNPSPEVDIHMSPAGANLSCQACHQMQDHHVLGRGLDLRESDRPERMDCLSGGCHSPTPHPTARLNAHTARVACQSCHIPRFAKVITTEVERDWTQPFWFQGMLLNQGGFKPEEIRQGNVVPSYLWYNGTSYVYNLGQQPRRRADGMYELAAPYGSVHEGKITPMKEHISNSAMQDASGQMIPFSTFTFFTTGDFNRAVQAGQQYSGLSGPWSMVNVHTYQTINHQVESSALALACGECHRSYSAAGAPTRLDLQGSLGYALAGPTQAVCVRCHEQEGNPGFASVHQRHVDRMRIDCSSCHTFTRPERQLQTGIISEDD